MRFVELSIIEKDYKCGNHTVENTGTTRILKYYGTPICVMNLANKTFSQPNRGYSPSTSKAQTQYRNYLTARGYLFQKYLPGDVFTVGKRKDKITYTVKEVGFDIYTRTFIYTVENENGEISEILD